MAFRNWVNEYCFGCKYLNRKKMKCNDRNITVSENDEACVLWNDGSEYERSKEDEKKLSF